MAGIPGRRRREEQGLMWPGFVDAMAQLLLVIIFVLTIFVVAQFMQARELSGQDTVLAKLRQQIAELSEMLALERSAKARLESTLAALTDDLNAERGKVASLSAALAAAQGKEGKASALVADLRSKLAAEKKISAEALAQIELLNQQIAALRRQVQLLNAALEAAEERDRKAKAQIANLGKRLNAALARRVQELSRYRSEFFGRLRRILSQRADIRVVGDRFVFQAEVLFPKGSAELTEEGKRELDKLAEAIKELEKQIPPDINWILRVDGHTDSDPIHTPRYASNWELSAARAISVVKYLISKGVPPERLAATGFGEFHPLDPRDTEEAKAKNRRIELKLTER
ncbi:peptidoglycan -binding protein [Thermopetrobacter sp. TC1]|uniref:peptidoglycan -binding protein n=1 Tax=Thermopetrobacter sp. TC1 TaxID=1495045 RepID=UPI0005718EB5|nr:peptidoglycan -binding protein [Thermopetrobacter sp. TC1]